MANGPFIDDLPIQSGDFPQLCSIKGMVINPLMGIFT